MPDEKSTQVILNNKYDWDTWIQSIKTLARQYHVWEYVNPDSTTATPKEPDIPDIQDSDNTATLERKKMVYLRDQRLWNEATKGIDHVLRAINKSVPKKHHGYYANLDEPTPRAIITALQARLKPDEDDYCQVIRKRFEALMNPNRSTNINQWIDDWVLTYTQAINVGLPGITTNRQYIYDFIRVAGRSFEVYRDMALIRFRDKKTDMFDVADDFRDYLELRGVSSTKSSFATFKGETDSPSNSNSSGNKRGRSSSPPTCVCGDQHWFRNCPYLIESKRPQGWRPDPVKQAQVDQPKPQKIRTGIQRAQEAEAGGQGQQQGGGVNQGLSATRLSAQSATCLPTKQSTSFSTNTGYELANSFIWDSGADTHIGNDRSRFGTYQHAPDGELLRAGDSYLPILGYGTISLRADGINGERHTITLNNAAHIPGFHTNVVSAFVAKASNVFQNGRLNILEYGDGRPFCKLHDIHRQSVIEYNPISEADHAAFATKRTQKSAMPVSSTSDITTWHRRFGHLNYEAVGHLPETATGINISGDSRPAVCESCALSKITSQISRRPIRKEGTKPFQTLHMDIMQLSNGFNSSSWFTHAHDEVTRWSIGVDHAQKNGMITALFVEIDYINAHYLNQIKFIHTDQDPTFLGAKFMAELNKRSIKLITTVRYTAEQNPISERTGRTIAERARADRIDAKFPEDLWPEIYHITIRKMNLAPFRQPDDSWKSPYNLLMTHLGKQNIEPNVGSERMMGSRAYVKIPKELMARTSKLASRAWIGYLLGAEGTNIYRVWIPSKREVISVRDVIIDETVRYDPNQPFLEDSLATTSPEPSPTMDSTINTSALGIDEPNARRQALDEMLEGVPQPHEALQSGDPTLGSELKNEAQPDITSSLLPTPDATPEPIWGGEGDHDDASNQLHQELSDGSELSPFSGSNEATIGLAGPSNIPNHETPGLPRTFDNDNQHPEEAESSPSRPGYGPAPIPSREIISDITTDNTVSGKRIRKPSDRRAAYQAQLETTNLNHLTPVYNAFSAGQVTNRLVEKRLHRDDLPAPPQNRNEMLRHQYKDEFIAAEATELSAQQSRGTFKKVPRSKTRKRPLPLRWVYDYKFDNSGYLINFKSRLCVRGDQQEATHEETRASTLAARTFRTLMALTAQFDLETQQWDAVNAFLNSKLDEIVYVGNPPGYDDPHNILILILALYGLRRSPRLWQLEFTKSLVEFGLQPVPEDPCLLTTPNIIVMFYVDDIIAVYHRRHQQEVDDLFNRIQHRYKLRNMGEASWFLGIRILRDRSSRKLWLCQDSYIDKIVNRFHLSDRSPPATPLAGAQSIQTPNTEDVAGPQRIYGYQQRIGSILYAAIITRPDIAFACSQLSRFLLNPGQKHVDAADRVIAYLAGTKHYGIEYGQHRTISPSGEIFICSSDAAFADNPDRKSTEGYHCTLFGGSIDWRSGKQRTVTTSSTEAELLSLSEAAKQLAWWKRLFQAIDFNPEHTLHLKCDNQQTIGLIMKEEPPLSTRLRHVDIHRHWLRQEAQAKRAHIDWVPTNSMTADGLTKALPSQRHEVFIRILGLRDIHHVILA